MSTTEVADRSEGNKHNAHRRRFWMIVGEVSVRRCSEPVITAALQVLAEAITVGSNPQLACGLHWQALLQLWRWMLWALDACPLGAFSSGKTLAVIKLLRTCHDVLSELTIAVTPLSPLEMESSALNSHHFCCCRRLVFKVSC